MSRLRPGMTPVIRLSDESTGAEWYWKIDLAGVVVGRLSAAFVDGRPVHVSLEPFVFDLDDWCDYLCDGCGRGGEGEPWRTVLGGERPAEFHGPGCLAKWAGDSMQALPDRPPSL